MLPVEKVVKMSPNGQITLPKRVRERLRSQVVRIVADDDTVKIEAARDLAGSLREYAQPLLTPDDAKETAWAEAMCEKHPRR